MRIEDALDRFITQIRADGRSEHTIGQYRRHIGVLDTWLDRERPGMQIQHLDHEDIAAFMNSPTARTRPDGMVKKANSLNALRTSLRCFFAYVHAAGWTPSNPARLLRRAILLPGPPRAIGNQKVACLLATLKQGKGTAARRDHALFAFLLGTGIRLSSALALQIEDVDLDRGEALLRHAKGGRTDVVFLGKKVRERLARYLGDRRTGVVFPGANGRPLSRRHAARRFAMAIQAAGITRGYSPHALRHTFGTRVYRATGDLLVTQQVLRHRSITSTAIYAAANPGRIRAVLEACRLT